MELSMKSNKYKLYLFLILNYSQNCLSININLEDNYLDSNGKKQGFWNYCNSGLCFDAYYLNDTLDGVFKSYYQNLKISSFGEYHKGNMIGTWYYFDELGHLYMELSNFEYKGYRLRKDDKDVEYKIKSYLKIYDPKGNCIEEGFAFYDDAEVEFEKIQASWHYN